MHWKEILLQKVFYLKCTSQGEMADVYATFNMSFNFENTPLNKFQPISLHEVDHNRLQTNNAVLSYFKKEARKGK